MMMMLMRVNESGRGQKRLRRRQTKLLSRQFRGCRLLVDRARSQGVRGGGI